MDLKKAREAFQEELRSIGKADRVVILHDRDADGMTAGVLLEQAMSRLGYSNVARVMPDLERNPWSPKNVERVAKLAPRYLFMLDLGSGPEEIVTGVRTCFIDHHNPGEAPVNSLLISAYRWHPIPNTSLLVWELVRELVDVSDLDWIAAIGALSDLGDKPPFELVDVAKKKYTAKYLKEATTMINAVRRCPTADPELAVPALRAHRSPRELVESKTQEVAQMRELRKQVSAALNEAKKAAPVFAGKVALIRINTPFQIHPLIAQIWRTRLPKYIVMAANEGYLPGKVNFSARATGGVNVLEFLRSVKLSPGEGTYGQGHDQASGGSLPYDRWNEFLTALGFPPSVHLKLKVAA